MATLENYPPYLLQKNGKSAVPLLIASPHSGTFYPERLFKLSDLTLADFQKYEDPAVTDLFSFAPAMGLPLLSAVYGRAWVDLNRHPLELDPALFFDEIPPQALTDSPRVKAGYGVIPTRLSPTLPVYPKQLLWAKEQSRLTRIHFPYHAALTDLINKNIAAFGYSVLIDVHSMPDLPPEHCAKGQMPDIVLGDADGVSCSPALTAAAADILRDLGFFVTVNLPYAGAYTTRYYGHPDRKSHVLQIEIARALYWDADKHQASENFKNLWFKLSLFTERLIRFIKTKK